MLYKYTFTVGEVDTLKIVVYASDYRNACNKVKKMTDNHVLSRDNWDGYYKCLHLISVEELSNFNL